MADPVVDTLGQQELQGIAHAFRTAGLAGVDRAVQAGLRRPMKRLCKTRASSNGRRFASSTAADHVPSSCPPKW
jgi:hypothetical protein